MVGSPPRAHFRRDGSSPAAVYKREQPHSFGGSPARKAARPSFIDSDRMTHKKKPSITFADLDYDDKFKTIAHRKQGKTITVLGQYVRSSSSHLLILLFFVVVPSTRTMAVVVITGLWLMVDDDDGGVVFPLLLLPSPISFVHTAWLAVPSFSRTPDTSCSN